MRTKTITTRRFWVAFLMGTLALPLAVSASVQPEGRRAFRGDHGGRGGFGPFGMRAILRELDLSEDQREQLRALRGRSTSRETVERMMERRRALEDAIQSGADEGTLRQLAYDYGQVEGDLAVERARMHAEMMSILTPEQQAQYETLVEERKQEMEERRERFQKRMENRRNREPDSF